MENLISIIHKYNTAKNTYKHIDLYKYIICSHTEPDAIIRDEYGTYTYNDVQELNSQLKSNCQVGSIYGICKTMNRLQSGDPVLNKTRMYRTCWNDCFLIACEFKHVRLAILILRLAVLYDQDIEWNNAFFKACRNGNMDIYDLTHIHCSDDNIWEYGVMFACCYNRIDIIKRIFCKVEHLATQRMPLCGPLCSGAHHKAYIKPLV